MLATINGSPVVLLAESPSLDDRIGQRSQMSFAVIDAAGVLSFKQGMPVDINLDDGSDLFTGYVWSSKGKREAWLGLKVHRLTCVDGVYLADKRIAVKTYQNVLAGDAVSDLVQTYLEPEGVIGRHVARTETTQGDWTATDPHEPDSFQTDTSALYTAGGDVAATWTFDTANARLVGTGGTQGTLVRNGRTLSDGTITAIYTQAEDAGILLRYQDNNNYYMLAIRDNSSSQLGDHSLRLYKRVASSFTALGLADVNFVRGTAHTISISATGSALAVSFDGVQVFTASDAAFSSGLAGVRNNHATASRCKNLDIILATPTLDATLSATASPANLVLAQAGANVSRAETSTADFAGGTITNVVAGSTGGGDVELNIGANFSATETSQADFNTGTLTNTLSEASNDLSLNGFWRDWTDNTTTGQTLFGASSPTQSASSGQYLLGSAAANESHARFDNSPSLADFTCEFDAEVRGSGYATSLLFRTTNWQNANGTWAYEALITTTNVAWRRGTNTGTTTQTITNIANAAPSGLVSGTMYRVKVTMSGSTCTITVNGTLIINTTDATFGGAGQFGCRFFNNGGGADSVKFDNFGVVAAMSGTWVKDYDFNTVRSAQASLISWNAVANGQTILVEAALSTNSGGSYGAFSACTSGAAIPVLDDVTSYITTGRLRIRITLTSTDARAYFHVDDITTSVTAGYGITGTHNRVWPTLSLAPAVTAGSAIISWNATVPANTTLTVETSINGGSTYQAATSGSAISGLSSGTALAGISLLVRVNLASTKAGSTPMLLDLTVVVTSQYAASGMRVSPALSLKPAGVARASSIAWNATLNGGTLLVETSLDGGATWQTASSGSAIPGLSLMGPLYFDGFDVDTSASYNLYHAVIDPANSRATLAGPASDNASIGYGGVNAQDVEVIARVDLADDFGILFRHDVPNSRQWSFFVRDASSVLGSSGWQLIKYTTGFVFNEMASGSLPAGATGAGFVRGESHVIRVTCSGPVVRVYFDGTLLTTVTDAPGVWAGDVGLITQFNALPIAGQARTFEARTWGADLTAPVNLLVRETLTAPAGRAASPSMADLTVTAKTQQIADGPTVQQLVLGYVKVSDALTRLAEVSNTWWNIDAGKRLWFVGSTVQEAPWDATAADMHDEDVTEVEDANPLYRNRQYLIGGYEVTSTQTESIKGDGATRAFALAYQVNQVPSSITVNGVAKTLGIKQLDAGKDFYWAKGDNIIAQDTGGTLLTSSDTLQVQYKGQWPTSYLAADSGAITDMQTVEGGTTTGYVEDVDSVSGVTGSSALSQIANGKLARFAQFGRKLTFATLRPGLRSGQLLVVTLPEHGLNSAQLLIESVAVREVGLRLWYTVTAIIGPIDTSWPAFFQALAGVAEGGVDTVNLGASGTLVINQAVSETWTWGESVTETVFSTLYPDPALYPAVGLFPA